MVVSVTTHIPKMDLQTGDVILQEQLRSILAQILSHSNTHY